MNRTTYLIGLVLSLFSLHVIAQDYNFEWAQQIQSDEFSSIGPTQIDYQGNLISLGSFDGTLTYQAQSGDTSSTSNGHFNFFIQKMTPNGDLLWLNTFESTGYEYATSMDIDQFGNIYIAGKFNEIVDFDPGIGVHNLDADNDQHLFVAKYNNDGEFIWVKDMKAPHIGPYGGQVKVDDLGNVYLVGDFRNQIDFDPGVDTFMLDAGTGYTHDIFIQKLNPQGDFVWAKQIESNGYISGGVNIEITQDNNLLLGGSFSDTIDFDPGLGVNNLVGHPAKSIFLLKLESSGDFIWAKQIGNHGQSAQCLDLLLDLNENIVLSGFFSGTVDFDPGVGVENHTCDGYMSSYIVKLDYTGEFIWSKDFPMYGSMFSFSQSLASDQFENLYLTLGHDTIMVDSLTFESEGLNNYQDILTMKLNDSGDVLWGLDYGGLGLDICTDIVVSDSGEIYTSGHFHQTIDLDPSIGVAEFAVVGAMASANGFIQKLNQCFTTTTDTYTLCDSLVWIDGNTYYENNQSATYTYSTESDCDSIVVLDLNITELSPTVSQFGSLNILTEQTWDTYQWVDCNNNFEEIPLETSFLFTPTVGGTYAVMVELDGCTSISECFTFEPFSIKDDLLNLINLTPNPTNGLVTIDIKDLEKVSIKVFDVLGNIIQTPTELTESNTQIELNGEPGIYMIELSLSQSKRIYRVIKL